MSLLRQIARGLRALTNRAASDRDIADEVGHYLDEATAEFERQGLPPDEARRAARMQIGGTAQVREQVREYGWENVVATAASDLAYGMRQLRTNAGFAITSIVILALGIGASTAIFSAVKPILLEPLPYPHADRLVTVWEQRGEGGRMVNFGSYLGLADRARTFESLAVMKAWTPAISGAGEPERFDGQRVTPGYFRALGVSPAIGRDFSGADDLHHGPNVVILSHALWVRRFAGDKAALGRGITLDGAGFTIIGVMPDGFENVLAPTAGLWAPLQYDPSLPADGREWGHHLRMIGRLKPGVTRDQARNDLATFIRPLAGLFARGYANSGGPPDGFIVRGVQSDLVADIQPALLAVVGAVVLVLLIACVNVASLLLTRAAHRRGEFTMRAALGAGRSRLTRQVLSETLLLTAIGGVAGIVVAGYGVSGLVALSPAELPRVHAIRVDGYVLAFATCITALVGLFIGMVPAVQACRADLRTGLQQRSQRTAGGHAPTRRALVVVEVALALVLLVNAGLLFHSLQRLFAVAPGFDPSHVLTMQVQTSGARSAAGADGRGSFDQALEAVARVPGVQAAAFTSQLPLSGDYDEYGIRFEKDIEANGGPAFRYAVTPGYFAAMHIPLRRGRLLNEHDTADRPLAILINESFAKREFQGRDPIGQRVRVGADTVRPDRPWGTVVGVVGDVKQASLAVGQEDAFYLATWQWPFPDTSLCLVARVSGDVAAFAPPIRHAVWSADKDLPIARVATMERVLAASEARRRFALIVFETFALLALVLSATGIYGVLSGSVTERTREIGVRATLGASRAAILGLVVREALTLTAAGVAIGLCGAAFASRALTSLLFGISRLDPAAYLGVVGLLAAVAIAAASVPAWRAAHVDPAITLRAE